MLWLAEVISAPLQLAVRLSELFDPMSLVGVLQLQEHRAKVCSVNEIERIERGIGVFGMDWRTGCSQKIEVFKKV